MFLGPNMCSLKFIFCFLIVEVVIQIYTCSKIHRTVQLSMFVQRKVNKLHFII
jgi:hypothetical protein